MNDKIYHYKAVLFDLDGVITKTASLHAAAWKEAFDDFLASLPGKNPPFDSDRDYRDYVDGKPRYDGVEGFLKSRNIVLPYGSPDDAPGLTSVVALGNLKDRYFSQLISKRGVEVFQSTIELIRILRQEEIIIGVVSSSKHCRDILDKEKITSLFDTICDGNEAEKLHLKGKPAPDTYVNAAQKLGFMPSDCVVVEDAEAGVQAGKAGGFGLVIGINREDYAEGLKQHGADIVVNDLSAFLENSRL